MLKVPFYHLGQMLNLEQNDGMKLNYIIVTSIVIRVNNVC